MIAEEVSKSQDVLMIRTRTVKEVISSAELAESPMPLALFTTNVVGTLLLQDTLAWDPESLDL